MLSSRAGLAVILALAALLSFSSSLGNGFVYDDHFQIQANPYIREFRHLKVLFTTDMWHFSKETDSIYYRPLHATAYLLIYKIFGMKPFGFHLSTVLLHALCTILIWLVLSRYTNPLQAFPGALLFATHPVHVENVAWVAGIHDILCGVFIFLAFWLYLRNHLWLSLLPLFAGFLTKEPAILFPAVLIADQLLFTRYKKEKFLAWLSCVAGLGLVYFAMRISALGGLSATNPEFPVGPGAQIMAGISFAGLYLGKLLFPLELNALYDYRLPLTWNLALPGILIVICSIFLAWTVRKNKTFLVGAALFLVMLLPALVVGAVSAVLFAERYLYLPSAGFCLCIVSFDRKRLFTILLLFVCILFGWISFNRSTVWKDDLTLWTDTVEKSPESASANYNLATALLKQKDHRSAAHFFNRTISLDPNRAAAYFSLSVCLYSLGDEAGAKTNLQRFLKYWDKDDAIRKEAISRLKQLESKMGPQRHQDTKQK